MIHPLADVKSNNIGENTTIWQYAVVLQNAVIGSNCNINCHTFIENDVQVGNNVTIKAGVYLWDGLTLKDNVFIGPNVTFTNDKFPRSKKYPSEFQRTILEKGASIGAGAIIMGGITIGEYSMVAAGALVTKKVPSHALVMGIPAKIVSYVNEDGSKMDWKGKYYMSRSGKKYFID